MGRLDGKVAIVTGAGSGIGKATALLFAAEGAKVVCADINGAAGRAVADHIGDRALALTADVTIAEDVARTVAIAEERWGGLDVLFNNAGFGGPLGPLAEQTEENFDRIVGTNLKSAFLGIKFGVLAMLRGGRGGSIINTASSVGLVGYKGHSVYSAAKAGVIHITKCAALDYAEAGVRINAVCPGMTWTGLVAAAAGHEDPLPEVRAPQPMNRWGRAAEVAAGALFLASDEASFVTGVALPVDGGFAIGWNESLPSVVRL